MVFLIVLDLLVSTLGRYASLERTYFKFLLWEDVGVLKKIDFNSLYFGKGVVVLKELDLTVFTLQGFCGLESPGFNSF